MAKVTYDHRCDRRPRQMTGGHYVYDFKSPFFSKYINSAPSTAIGGLRDARNYATSWSWYTCKKKPEITYQLTASHHSNSININSESRGFSIIPIKLNTLQVILDRRLFNHLHWYWQPNKNNQQTEDEKPTK